MLQKYFLGMCERSFERGGKVCRGPDTPRHYVPVWL